MRYPTIPRMFKHLAKEEITNHNCKFCAWIATHDFRQVNWVTSYAATLKHLLSIQWMGMALVTSEQIAKKAKLMHISHRFKLLSITNNTRHFNYEGEYMNTYL